MKTLNRILAAIAAFITVSACSEKEQPVPELYCENNTVSASAKGGTYNIPFTIVNAYEGVSPVPSSDADWISGLSIETGNILKIKVEPNSKSGETTIERTGNVTVTYNYNAGAVSFSVKVVQKGLNLSPEFTLASDEDYSISSASKQIEVSYSIDSPAEGAEIQFECEADWIKATDITETGAILNIEANTDENGRRAEAVFKYVWEDDEIEQVINIDQASGLIEYNNMPMVCGWYYGKVQKEDGSYSTKNAYEFYITNKGFGSDGYSLPDGAYFHLIIYTENEPDDWYAPFPEAGEYIYVPNADEYNGKAFTSAQGYIKNDETAMSEDMGAYDSGKVTIEKLAQGYKIKLSVTFKDGRKATAIYRGNPIIVNESATLPLYENDVVLNPLSCTAKWYNPAYGGNNFWFTFYQTENDGRVYKFQLYIVPLLEEISNHVITGTFPVRAEGESLAPFKAERGEVSTAMGTFAKGTFVETWLESDPSHPYYLLVTGGSVRVGGSYNNYEITFDFTTDNGKTITGSYNGPVRFESHLWADNKGYYGNVGEDIRIDFHSILEDKVLDLSRIQTATAWYKAGPLAKRTAANDWVISILPQGTGDGLSINLFSTGGLNDGPAEGTYTAGTSGANNTFYAKYDLKGSYYYLCHGSSGYTGDVDLGGRPCSMECATDGTVTLKKNSDGTYTIDFDLVNNLGKKFSGSWTGMLDKKAYMGEDPIVF
ncbi:MAG: BACON domain-containing protein [Candidatus Cryptobacteroides sp.]